MPTLHRSNQLYISEKCSLKGNIGGPGYQYVSFAVLDGPNGFRQAKYSPTMFRRFMAGCSGDNQQTRPGLRARLRPRWFSTRVRIYKYPFVTATDWPCTAFEASQQDWRLYSKHNSVLHVPSNSSSCNDSDIFYSTPFLSRIETLLVVL